MHLVSHETPTFRHKNVNIIVNQGVQKLSCSRQFIKSLFEKLCPTVNYSTERYIFSHKSVALSTLVRCKFSFYFFWKILHTPGFCLQKHVWTQKKRLFFKNVKFWSFCCKHTEQNIWKLIQNTKLHELCAVMKGLDDISFISSVHFYTSRLSRKVHYSGTLIVVHTEYLLTRNFGGSLFFSTWE